MTPHDRHLRSIWQQRINIDLPQAALSHKEWPVRLNHCFARIILDHVCGGPWRNFIKAPAYRYMDETQCAAAVNLADAILVGRIDLRRLNSQSLQWRGKA